MTDDEVQIFLGCLVVIAVSVWMVFFKARIPVPAFLPRGVTRFVLEVLNDWLRLFGGLAGCLALPIALMLALAVLMGGMTPFHFIGAMLLFGMIMVWRMR